MSHFANSTDSLITITPHDDCVYFYFKLHNTKCFSLINYSLETAINGMCNGAVKYFVVKVTILECADHLFDH